MAAYKQRCAICKKNMVLVTSRWQFPKCYECQKAELNVEIKDPKMKKMFDIPEEFYRDNPFLRSIKSNYLRFDSLSERQIEAFQKTVEEMKTGKGRGQEKSKEEPVIDTNISMRSMRLAKKKEKEIKKKAKEIEQEQNK
jgi:hypothetical protein